MYNTCKTTAYRRSLLNVESKSTLADAETKLKKNLCTVLKKLYFEIKLPANYTIKQYLFQIYPHLNSKIMAASFAWDL